MKKHVVVIGPAWGTSALLDPLCKFLEAFNLSVTIAPMRGHYADSAYPEKLDGASLETYQQDVENHVKSLTDKGDKAFLIGISMGAVIAHRISEAFPQRVAGVVMYGSPMLGPLPWGLSTPLLTSLRILFNPAYWKIFKGQGSVALHPYDVQDFLYSERDSGIGMAETMRMSESCLALREMMFGHIRPSRISKVRHWVFTCDGERFHYNYLAKRWADKQGAGKGGVRAKYENLPGDHFRLLSDKKFHKEIKHALEEAGVLIQTTQEEEYAVLPRPPVQPAATAATSLATSM